MGKSKKKANRQNLGHSDSEEEGDGEITAATTSSNSRSQKQQQKTLNFAERRELQRKDNVAKIRAKQRCFLCGKRGHIRRDCPGIENDRGALKSGSGKKQSKNRGRKVNNDESENKSVDYPEGFEPFDKQRQRHEEEENDCSDKPFYFYDASCESTATLEYIRNGRGRQKISTKEAIAEYQSKIQEAKTLSNYGGRITRSFIRPNRPWDLRGASPLSSSLCDSETNGDDEKDDPLWFVIGLTRDFLYNDNQKEAAVASLLEAQKQHSDKIVGFFSDLDYSKETLARPGCDKEHQIRRLGSTCQAASEASIPIQIRVLPAGPISRASADEDDTDTAAYRQAIEDLEEILTAVIEKYPLLKIHLSCWSGEADDMTKLLSKFTDNLWLGMDATVTFAKVTRAHECAFDIPLDKLLLETGTPTTIPATIARAKGRDAFNHSGLIPYIAEAIASEKSKTIDTSPREVARDASYNTLHLYPSLVD